MYLKHFGGNFNAIKNDPLYICNKIENIMLLFGVKIERIQTI